jgi:hypothetical protein
MCKSASPAGAIESLGTAETEFRSRPLRTREAGEELGLSECSVRCAIQRGAAEIAAPPRVGGVRLLTLMVREAREDGAPDLQASAEAAALAPAIANASFAAGSSSGWGSFARGRGGGVPGMGEQDPGDDRA